MAFADYDKIVLFGDSITEQSLEQTRGFGFGAAITDTYRRKLEVMCRGFSGYNTANALWVLPKFCPAPCDTSRIKLVIVFFGANDAVLGGQLQHVHINEYRENLKKILNHPSFAPHNPKFVLITPPAMCEYTAEECDAAKGKHYIQRLAKNTMEYARVAREVGKECGVPTVDLWKAFIDYAGGWKEGQPLPGCKECPRSEKLGELLRDGLHFMPKGYKIMYNEVMRCIMSNYPEFNPEKLNFVFPYWEQAPRAS